MVWEPPTDVTRGRAIGHAAPLAAGLLAVVCALTLLSGCGQPGGEPAAAPSWMSGSGEATTAPAAESTPPVPTPTPATPKPTATPAPKKTTAPGGHGKYVFPVAGSPVSWHHTHSGYKATDIFANCGQPVRAATDGTVLEVNRTDTYSESGPQGPDNGGLSVSLLGTDGVRYYGSHMSKILSGIRAGVPVKAGQQLGSVGKTGNANNVCHLHFGISPPCARTGDWWIRRGVVWPYPYLDSWKAGGQKSPVAEVAAFTKSKGCPKEPAS